MLVEHECIKTRDKKSFASLQTIYVFNMFNFFLAHIEYSNQLQVGSCPFFY